MVTFPSCKINLGLHVLVRRQDGYHDISTCFYPVPWRDALEILPAASLEFKQTGISIPGSTADNLCVKAYEILKGDFQLPPVRIHLHKVIPTGAGLGGGSSDAAHALLSLISIFQLNLSQEQLMGYALRLGSDCPFFTLGEPMIGSGRGELLTRASVNLKGFYLVILTPGIHVATAEAYAGVTPKIPTEKLPQLISEPIASWKATLSNDFETSVFKKYPLLGAMKETLYEQGAIYASMSGSGSSIFGIFEKEARIENLFMDVPRWSGWL